MPCRASSHCESCSGTLCSCPAALELSLAYSFLHTPLRICKLAKRNKTAAKLHWSGLLAQAMHIRSIPGDRACLMQTCHMPPRIKIRKCGGSVARMGCCADCEYLELRNPASAGLLGVSEVGCPEAFIDSRRTGKFRIRSPCEPPLDLLLVSIASTSACRLYLVSFVPLT